MLVAVLGPVIVVVGGEAKSVDVAKHRAVLSTLALHGGRVVDTSELIDAIWGDDPPATAAKTLQGYVSALRKQFGPDLVATEPGGYRLGDAVDDVDVTEFEHAIDLGRDHLDGGRPDAAVRAFRSALARWRGRPLVDLADGPVAAGHVARLDELRALARAGEIEGELASGHHREVVPELERLVREYPYREHLWRLLMLALYRSGRAAEAIDAFERARAILANDLGVDPSAPTSALRRRIGEHDSSLDAPFVPPPTNLSARLDRFVGRDGERLRLTDEIERHRLVALVGVGGVGKSRLANEFARTALDRFPGGVWWVDLATSDVATSVAALTAAAMDVQSGHRVEPALAATLRRAPTLLIIDNCEHRAEDVARFVTWVTSEVDTVRILATSRLRLDVIGCRHIVVEPLDTTGPDSGAVELFSTG